MARIYIARSTGIGSFERHVVLKLITPERANDTNAVQMFLDEARLAACLNHQNVAQVFEVGEDAGIHYLAMEYVHGQDLRALLAKAGSQGTRVPLELALTTVAGAAAGLNHAHERRDSNGTPLGIVHRDVSPSNIMIGLDGSVKLLDFGIAKATQRSVETQAGIIKGKFAYMAPEQCRGRDVDRRSDVFSLGIILYEITTQHRCFRAESDFDTMHRIVTGDVVRPTRLVQGYPPALEAIVMKALAVDANQRYQSAGALLEAIESFSVSARMSLSTMSLGRFMRELFGETPEPWLMNHAQRASHQSLPQPKESTVSNTNGTGSEPVREVEPGDARISRTLLELPRGESQSEGSSPFDEVNAAEWNAKSYPTMQPSYASTNTLTPEAKPNRTSSPALLPVTAAVTLPMGSGSQAEVQAPAFPMQPGPGSGSGPAHSAHAAQPAQPAIITTRNGYASASASRSDVSYPRYEPAESSDDIRVQPSRRPLFVGLGVVVLGVAIVLAMVIGGSDCAKSSTQRVATSGSDQATARNTISPEISPDSATQVVVAPVTEPDAPNAQLGSGSGSGPDVSTGEESISIQIVSIPSGADVLLSGKPIGTTPLDTKIKRGTGSATLVVHRAGYEDVPTKIDLTGDFSKEVTLVKVPEKLPPVDKKPTTEKKPVDKKPADKKPSVDKKPEGTSSKSPTPTSTVDKKPPEKKPVDKKPVDRKPACQPQNQVDPFDSRPVCK